MRLRLILISLDWFLTDCIQLQLKQSVGQIAHLSLGLPTAVMNVTNSLPF